MEKISVIIPVWNAEKFLVDTVGSVLNQTYKNIEVICVNDGSTDNSLEVLKEIQKNNEDRLVIIDQENQGGSVARNVGLDNATGDYIAFLDSDDMYHPQYLEILYDNLKKYNADVSVCKWLEFTSQTYNFNNSFDVQKIKPKSVLNNPFFDKFVLRKKVQMYMWLKLAKKEVYDNIRFDLRLPVMNDTLFLWEVLYKSKKCVNLNEKLVAYRVRGDSLSHQPKFTLKRFNEYCNSIIAYNDFLNKHKLNFLEKIALKRVIAKNVYHIYYALTKNSEIYKENYNEVANSLIKLWKDGLCHFQYLSIPKFFKIHNDFKKMLNGAK